MLNYDNQQFELQQLGLFDTLQAHNNQLKQLSQNLLGNTEDLGLSDLNNESLGIELTENAMIVPITDDNGETQLLVLDRNSNMAREAVRTTMNSLSQHAPVEHNTLQQQVAQPEPVHTAAPMVNLAAPQNVAKHATVIQPEHLEALKKVTTQIQNENLVKNIQAQLQQQQKIQVPQAQPEQLNTPIMATPVQHITMDSLHNALAAPKAQPEQLDIDINKIIQGSLGTAMAGAAGGMQIYNGASAGDGKAIADGVLGSIAAMAPQIQQIVDGSMSEELHQAPVQPQVTQQHLNSESHKQVIADALNKAIESGKHGFHKVMTGVNTAAQDVQNVVNDHQDKIQTKEQQKGFDIAQAVLNGLQAITHESVQMSDKIKAAQNSGDSEKVISEAMAGLFAIGKDAADMVSQLKKAQEQAAMLAQMQTAPQPEIKQLEELKGKKLIQLNDGSLAILEDDWFTPQLETMYAPEEEMIAELSSEYFTPSYYYGY